MAIVVIASPLQMVWVLGVAVAVGHDVFIVTSLVATLPLIQLTASQAA